MKDTNFFKNIKVEVNTLFFPLLKTNGDKEKLIQLFSEFGWDIKAILGENIVGLSTIVSNLKILTTQFNESTLSIENITDVEETIDKITDFFDLIKTIEEIPNIDTELVSKVIKDVTNKLFTLYLYNKVPLLYHSLCLYELIMIDDEDEIIHNGVQVNNLSIFPKLKLKDIGKIIKNPISSFKEIYYPEGINDYEEAHLVMSEIYRKVLPFLDYFGIESDINDGEDSLLHSSLDENLKGLVSIKIPINHIENDFLKDVQLTIGIIPGENPSIFIVPLTTFGFELLLRN